MHHEEEGGKLTKWTIQGVCSELIGKLSRPACQPRATFTHLLMYESNSTASAIPFGVQDSHFFVVVWLATSLGIVAENDLDGSGVAGADAINAEVGVHGIAEKGKHFEWVELYTTTDGVGQPFVCAAEWLKESSELEAFMGAP